MKKKITILGGTDTTPTHAQVLELRSRARSHHYTMNSKQATVNDLIHDGVPLNWAREIARLAPGRSLYLDSGNGSYDTITRVCKWMKSPDAKHIYFLSADFIEWLDAESHDFAQYADEQDPSDDHDGEFDFWVTFFNHLLAAFERA